VRGTGLLSAARCAEYVPKIIFSSVLTERPSDPALGELVLTSVTGTPAPTSSTARYLCSVTLNSHNMSGNVKHQAKPKWARSTGARNLDESTIFR